MYKILFVDDDPLILRRLHQILDWSSMGFKILSDAADGLAALEIMKNEVPDVMACSWHNRYGTLIRTSSV